MNTSRAYALDLSPYSVVANGYKFVFSSETNRNKYVERVRESVDTINHSLSVRWGYPVSIDNLGVLACYLKIEHRGCRIIMPDGSEIRQWEEITVKDGNIVKNVSEEL